MNRNRKGAKQVFNSASGQWFWKGDMSTCKFHCFLKKSYPEKKRRKGDITASRIGREKDRLQSILLLNEVKLML